MERSTRSRRRRSPHHHAATWDKKKLKFNFNSNELTSEACCASDLISYYGPNTTFDTGCDVGYLPECSVNPRW